MAKTTVGAGTRKKKPQISMIEIEEITRMSVAAPGDIGNVGSGGGDLNRLPGSGSCPTRMCWRCDPPDPCPGPQCW